MKKLFILLLAFCSMTAMGQYPISSTNITMPTQPAPNTADWTTGAVPFMINAQCQLVQGQLPPQVVESRILVIIKDAGNKICGAYNSTTAPLSNFNKANMSWSGAAALSLLGQECTLKAGTYYLCVQFFSAYAPIRPLSNEVCKTFTIADTKSASITAPQNLKPVDGKILTEQEAKQPIMLVWTRAQVIPPPVDNNITYKVRVVEIKEGQPKTQAFQNNPVLDEIEVKNLTQTPLRLAQRPNGIVWGVEAFSAERTNGQEPKSYGKSDPTTITFKKSDEDAKLKELSYAAPKNITPDDGKVFTKQEINQPIRFTWTPVTPAPKEPVLYKVRVLEIREGQNPTKALKQNTPVAETEAKDATETTLKLAQRCNDCTGWVWYVEAVGTERVQGGAPKSYGSSTPTSFSAATAICAMRPTLVETLCTGTTATSRTIRVKIKIENISSGATAATVYMNHLNTFTHPLYSSLGLNANNLIQGKDQSFVVSPGVNSVIAAAPPVYPATIAANSFVTQEVDVNINNSITSFRLLVITTSKGNNPGDALVPCYQDILIDNIPPCPCTYCKDDMIVFNGANQITDANNILTLNNNISIPGIQVKQFKAELIGFTYGPQNSNEQCWVCNKDDNEWGNFTGGTFSSPFPSMVNGVFPSLPCCGGNSHHTIGWWGAATVINNKPLQLKMSLPPASTLSCCPYNIEVCIRYTFTDADCRSCSVVRCFRYVRQPQTGGHGPLDSNIENESVPELGQQN